MIKKNSYIPRIPLDSEDGVDYINILKPNTLLGELLKPDHVYQFDTVFGNVVSVRRVMEYINRVDYPIKFLTKKKLTHIDVKRIKKCEIKHVKHYWAFILYALIKRVSKDTKLKELMLNNTLEYVALDEGVIEEELFNKKIEVKKHLTKLSYYTSCIRIVDELLKTGKLDDNEYISKLLDNEVNGDFFNKLTNINKLV